MPGTTGHWSAHPVEINIEAPTANPGVSFEVDAPAKSKPASRILRSLRAAAAVRDPCRPRWGAPKLGRPTAVGFLATSMIDQLTTCPQLFRILTILMSSKPEQEHDVNDDRAATLQLVIALGRSMQAIERGVRPHLVEAGLSLTEFAVLEVLYHKGALPLGQIRDRILVTGASTTYVVKKLEERGLMRRRTCTEDQRIVFGELTPRGRALIDKVFPAHVDRLRDVTAVLSASEKRATSKLLRRLSQHARHTTGESITEDD